MIGWDRCGESRLVAVLSRGETAVLRSYVNGLSALIEHRARSYTRVTTPRSEVGLPVGCAPDPRITAVLRSEIGDEPDWVLAVSEERCLTEVTRQLRVVDTTLPAEGGVVELASREEADAWAVCIRLVVTAITDAADDNDEVRGKPCAPTVSWLTELRAGLVTAPVRAGGS
ncbi:DUF2017 family protein [Lentzea sp. NPDC055074]